VPDGDDYSVLVSGAFLSGQIEKVDSVRALLDRLAEFDEFAGDEDLGAGLKVLGKTLSEVASDLHDVNMRGRRLSNVAPIEGRYA
jgi:hypothetical protein